MDKREDSHPLLNSKYLKTFLTLLTVVLIFVGPTYFVLFLWRGLNFNYNLSMTLGFSLFVIGLVLLAFLIRKKMI
jgi:hypothetical protein